MTCLLDVNVLLRLTQPAHSQHQESVEALTIVQRQRPCVLVPQTLYEFWVVASRPVEVNGLGLSVSDVHQKITDFMNIFRLLRDERTIFENWLDLVVAHGIKGVRAHDARYVAAMKRHGIKYLLTFNERDFRKFSDIIVLTPSQTILRFKETPDFLSP